MKMKNSMIFLLNLKTPPSFSKGEGLTIFSPLGRLGGAVLFTLLLLSNTVSSQINEYDYKRELQGISDEWHKIIVPHDVSSQSMRIYGINEDGETIEAPYMLEIAEDKTESKTYNAELLNESKKGSQYFFTYKMPTEDIVNHIHLDFEQENFDWKIKLEGSQDQKEWFTVVEDYRILSIKNEITDYQFTDITFKDAKYRYFRIAIDSNEKPELSSGSLALNTFTKGSYVNFPIQKTDKENNAKDKRTEITLDLGEIVPLSQVQLEIKDEIDYYRPLRIQYAKDSVQTQNGWKQNYYNLSSTTLNSMEESTFNFRSTTARYLKIVIDNYDNQPLEIGSIVINGYQYELITRLSKPAKYFLVYGNEKATAPQYDISYFKDKIPEDSKELTLGKVEKTDKAEDEKGSPLFENKMWLYGIMGLVIVVLGWFTFQMIKKEGKGE